MRLWDESLGCVSTLRHALNVELESSCGGGETKGGDRQINGPFAELFVYVFLIVEKL